MVRNELDRDPLAATARSLPSRSVVTVGMGLADLAPISVGAGTLTAFPPVYPKALMP